MVAKQAHRWFLNNSRRVEFDDLYQSGFLAMMEAVRTFDPDGGSSFLSWMGNNHLKTAFMTALGARTEKQRQDPLHTAASLDAPLQVDEDLTIGDMVQDPVDCMAKADRRIWLEQLHDELDRALDTLPAEQRTALRRRFYHGMTFAEAAALAGEKPDTHPEVGKCWPEQAPSREASSTAPRLRGRPDAVLWRPWGAWGGTGGHQAGRAGTKSRSV